MSPCRVTSLRICPDIDVAMVQDQGWAGMRNGAQLPAARETGFTALLTADRNLGTSRTFPAPASHSSSSALARTAFRICYHSSRGSSPCFLARAWGRSRTSLASEALRQMTFS